MNNIQNMNVWYDWYMTFELKGYIVLNTAVCWKTTNSELQQSTDI